MERFDGREEIEAVLRYSRDLIVVLDADGTIRYVSPAVEKILGYEPEDVVGKHAFESVHPDDRDRFVDQVSETIEAPDGATNRVRHRLDHATEGWVWVESIVSNHIESSLDGVLVNIREISEPEHGTGQDAINAFAIESALSGIAIADFDGEVIAANSTSLDMWGYESEDEVLGRHVSEFWESPSEVDDIAETLCERGEWQGELLAHRKDGSRFTTHCSITIVTDDEGSPLATMASFLDISRRKQYEHDLQLSRTLVNEANDAVYVVDVETGQLVDVNATACEMLGYRYEELLELSVPDISTKFDTVNEYREWVSLDSRSRVGPVKNEHVRADGSTVLLEITAKSLGVFSETYRIVIGRDITEREHRIRQMNVLDRVLRHNLRNDLSVVRGYAETLAAETDRPHTVYSESIVDASDSLLETAEKVRKITEILSNPSILKPVDVGEVIRDSIDEAQNRFPEADTDFDVDDELHANATDDVGRGIFELIENAIIHSSTDPANVSVTGVNRQDRIEISVVNSGSRIPEMDRKILGGSETIEPLYHGSGLGFWLVYLAVHRSRGTISVNREGDGNRITVRLERVESDSLSAY